MESTVGLTPEFIDEVRNSLKRVNPSRATIFGSSVNNGQQVKDIDILVLSKDFENIRFISRKELIELPEDVRFDLWLYTPYEFETLCPENHPLRESIEQNCINLFSDWSN